MERKRQKNYVDHGFGFPVRLDNVPMVKVRGDWTPDVNYVELANILLCVLAQKPARLTGDELKFIRTKLEMNLKDFGAMFDVTHPAVVKWEKAGAEATSIKWATEKDIRLHILSLYVDEEAFLKGYQRLRKKASNKACPAEVDFEKFALA